VDVGTFTILAAPKLISGISSWVSTGARLY